MRLSAVGVLLVGWGRLVVWVMLLPVLVRLCLLVRSGVSFRLLVIMMLMRVLVFGCMNMSARVMEFRE